MFDKLKEKKEQRQREAFHAYINSLENTSDMDASGDFEMLLDTLGKSIEDAEKDSAKIKEVRQLQASASQVEALKSEYSKASASHLEVCKTRQDETIKLNDAVKKATAKKEHARANYDRAITSAKKLKQYGEQHEQLLSALGVPT